MGTTTRIQIIREVTERLLDGDKICYQQVIVCSPDSSGELGLRFMRRRPDNGHLKALRGGAMIPESAIAMRLICKMETEKINIGM